MGQALPRPLRCERLYEAATPLASQCRSVSYGYTSSTVPTFNIPQHLQDLHTRSSLWRTYYTSSTKRERLSSIIHHGSKVSYHCIYALYAHKTEGLRYCIRQAQSQSCLTAQNLSKLPYTSNRTNYLRQDQNFERRAQGLPSRPTNLTQTLADFDRRWHTASSSSTSTR